MTAKTTLEKVMAVMQNIPGYTSWMKDCKEAKQIAKLSATSGIIFSVQATPWPIAEREAVVQFTFLKTAKPPLISVSMRAVPDALPVNPGRVRISQLKGYWKFSELSPDAVEITYSMHSEPGGSLPGWAVSGMVGHLPYQTLNSLRQLLEN